MRSSSTPMFALASAVVLSTACQWDSGATHEPASPKSESEEVAEPVGAAPEPATSTPVTAESLTESNAPIAPTKASGTAVQPTPLAPVCDPGTVACGTGSGGVCCKANQVCCPGGIANTYGCHDGKVCPKTE